MNTKQIIQALPTVSGSLEKMTYLKMGGEDKVLKDILLYTYDDIDRNYYIKNATLPDTFGNKSVFDIDGWITVKGLLDSLSSRKITGNEAREKITHTMSFFDKDSCKLILSILDRDLGCGISTSTINKVFPGLIPVFDVTLAEKYEGKNIDKVSMNGKDWFVSTKIDGNRIICVKKDNQYKFYSRKGKEVKTATNLIPDLDKLTLGKDNIVFDGELVVMGENGREDFTLVMNEIRKKDHAIDKPVYMIFDYLTYDEFFSGSSSSVFGKRYRDMVNLFGSTKYDTLRLLEQVELTPESFKDYQEKVSKYGWEGFMLRKNSTYRNGRSSDLLKVKKFYDDEFVVNGVVNDSMVFSIQGKGQEKIECLSSVEILYKGNKVNVGSGFTREERIRYFEHPEEILGKTITVQYFEETKNKDGGYSLRFPTLKYVHGDKREY